MSCIVIVALVIIIVALRNENGLFSYVPTDLFTLFIRTLSPLHIHIYTNIHIHMCLDM